MNEGGSGRSREKCLEAGYILKVWWKGVVDQLDSGIKKEEIEGYVLNFSLEPLDKWNCFFLIGKIPAGSDLERSKLGLLLLSLR